MKYKISNERLKLREYGRNVQMMVNYCKTLEDRDERNALCRDIVRIMASMNPNLRDGPDLRQKLWDHFYHLAEYDIDVDSEFPPPDPETMFTRPPERMPYLSKRSRFRQYGRNVELMADEAMRMEDEGRKHALVSMILNIMKMQIKGTEKDSNAELIVCDHLRVMTKAKLDYQPEDIRFHRYSATPPPQQQQQHHHGGKGGKKKGHKHKHKGKRK